MPEYVPTVVTECLRIVVCTRNRNPDNEQFRRGVIEPYNRIRKVQEEIERGERGPTEIEMREALDMLRGVFSTKMLPEDEQREWLEEVVTKTNTHHLFPELGYATPVHAGPGAVETDARTASGSTVTAPSRTTILLFPGQGSQRREMGQGLFEAHEGLTRQADEILGFSIRELCIEDPEKRLTKTQYTQPALYVVGALSYLQRRNSGALPPDLVAGHSVGEYTALFAAGAYDFATGLRLVKKRGELMSRQSSGGMAAVIGLTREEVESLLRDGELGALDVANFNSPTQTVVSGPRDVVLQARSLFEQAGAAQYVPLDVSGAFHSRHMVEAKHEFAQFLGPIQLLEPQVRVLSNYTALPHTRQEMKRNLVEQIDHPVRWVECMEFMLRQPLPDVEELGPGSVLTKLFSQMRERHEETRASVARAAERRSNTTGTGHADSPSF